jgi:hypothetical protein
MPRNQPAAATHEPAGAVDYITQWVFDRGVCLFAGEHERALMDIHGLRMSYPDRKLPLGEGRGVTVWKRTAL